MDGKIVKWIIEISAEDAARLDAENAAGHSFKLSCGQEHVYPPAIYEMPDA